MPQTLSIAPIFDEVHYIHTVSQMLAASKELELFQTIGTEQFLNHVSTVFYVPSLTENPPSLKGVEIAIHVGKNATELQRLMQSSGIRGLVGTTPQFPCSNPQASYSENLQYVEKFERHLLRLDIKYVSAWGRARDFKEGAIGCFILIDITPDDAASIIKDQLSFTYLPSEGKAQLISINA